MNKLLSSLVMASFALASGATFAAAHTGGTKDDKKTEEMKAECKKADPKMSDKMKADCKAMDVKK